MTVCLMIQERGLEVMSTQGAKKKRIGSRRRVTNQNKTSEDDDFLVKDSTTVAQQSNAAENAAVENAVTNPDNLLSETCDPPEVTANRRKLGSSRRHKGEKHVKATESHQKPKEEVEQKTRGSESPETDQVLGARELWKQEKLSQASEHEMSVAHESLLSVTGEDLLNLLPVRETNSDDREENSEVLRQDGNFQSNYLMCESDAELAVTQFSALSEKTTDESSHTEKNDIESYAGETFLLPHQEPYTKEEQNRIFSLSEVSQHSDDNVSKVTEEKQAQQYKLDDKSDSLPDGSQATKIISGNLEFTVSSTHQSGFLEKLTHDSDRSSKQEGFISHEKQDEQYEKVNFNTWDSNIYDHHVYDMSKAQASDADIADPKLGQVDEIGVDDNKQMLPQKPGITFAHDDLSESSIQMQPGTNFSFGSESHDNYAAKDEHDTGINPFEKRRKLGSSRRGKAIQQTKDSDAESNNKTMSEIEENMVDNEFITDEMVKQNLMESKVEEKVETEELGSQVKGGLKLSCPADKSTPEDQSGARDTCYQSDLKTDDSATNSYPDDALGEHPTKDNMEAFDNRTKDFNETPQISDREGGDTALDQSGGKAEVLIEAEESNSQTLQSELHDFSNTQPLETEDSLITLATELNPKPAEEDVKEIAEYKLPETPMISSADETAVIDKSKGAALEEVNTFETSHTQEMDEEVTYETDIGTLVDVYEISCLKTGQNLSDKSSVEIQDNRLSNLYMVSNKESKSTDKATELLKSQGNLKDDYLVSDSHLKVEDIDSFVVLETTATETNSPKELTDFDINAEHLECSVPQEELHADEALNEIQSFTEVIGALHSNDAVAEKVEHEEEVEQTQMQGIYISSEGTADDATESFTVLSENPTDKLSNSYGPELKEQGIDFATMEDNLNTDDSVLDNQSGERALSVAEESVVQSAVPFDSQPQVVSESNEEQTHTGFSTIKNQRELGSSQIHEDQQQVKDSVPELHPLQKVNKELETSQKERESQEELCQGSEFGITMPVTRDNTVCSAFGQSGALSSSSHYDFDTQSFVIISESIQQGHDESETNLRMEDLNKLDSMTLDGLESNDTQKEDLQGALDSDKALSKVQNQDVVPEQVQEAPECNNYSENVRYDATEYSVKNSGELIAEGEDSDIKQLELTVGSSVDSLSTKVRLHSHDTLEEHPTENINIEDLHQIDDDLQVYDPKTAQQINNTEREDTAQNQPQGFQEREGVFVGVEEGDSSSQTLQSHRAPNPQDQKTGGKENKDLAAETFHGHSEEDFREERENEPHDTMKTSFKEENVMQERLMDTTLRETATDDTAWTEDNDSQVDSCESTLVEELTVLCSDSTLDQQQHEELFSMIMPEEPPSLASGNENTKREMETDLFRLDGKLHYDHVVSKSALTEELSLGAHQPGKNTENESIVEQAACSSSQGELSANEDNREHNDSQVIAVCQSENSINEIHKEQTQMQEVKEVIHSTAVKESESSAHVLDFEPQLTEPSRNQLGSRRKLGSSRRNKRHQHVKDIVTESLNESKEELVEKKSSDEPPHMKTQDMVLVMEKEEESKEHTVRLFKSPVELGNDENPGTILSPNLMDSSAMAMAITSSLGQDDTVKSYQVITEDENMDCGDKSTHMGHHTVRLDMLQSTAWEDDSDMQNSPCHDDIVSARSFSSDPLEQEDDYHDQNKEAFSCDKDEEISVSQTNDVVDTAGCVTVDHSFTEEDTPMYALVHGKDEVEEKCKDPMKKYQEDQDSMASQEIKPSELFSMTHNKADLPVSADTGLDFRTEPSSDVGEQSGISSIVSAVDSQDETQVQTVLDESEKLQEKSKQRKRKFGSNRRILHKADREEAPENKDKTNERESGTAPEVKQSEKKEITEEISRPVSVEVSQDDKEDQSVGSMGKNQQKTNETESIPDFGQRQQISTSDLQRTESNTMPNKNPFLPSNDEEDKNTGESSVSVDETTQGPQNDERSESANAIQDQASKPAEERVVADLETMKSFVSGVEENENKDEVSMQESSTKDEGAQDTNLEIRNLGLILGSTSQRRKMGSTRKSLKPKTKEEDSPQRDEVHIKAAEIPSNVEGIKTDDLSGFKEEEIQLHGDKEDSESKLKTSPMALSAHPSSEENSVSHSQPLETELHETPSYPPTTQPTSTKHSVTAELASSGRRRKLGSHRKSHGHKNNESQTAGEAEAEGTENGNKSGSFTGQTEVKTTQEESLDQRDISEVEKTNTASPDVSSTEAGEDAKPLSERTPIQVTPAQHPNAKIQLEQERQETVSLDTSTEAAGKSKSYNVVMVGDSSVGKTSFMKRARSGKFSLDTPASIGIDSCLWTVVVDGKPVVLQLWDTAGQERFHSITRQVFHKAQAFLLMYDVTSSQSFSAVSYWASCIQDGAAEDVTVLLLGNKNDHAKRCVTTQQGETLAKEHSFEFMECSAATGENVIQSLETVARMLRQKVDTREEATVLFKEPQKKKSSGCC
ncbi:uncharacterized protein rab44 isoform X2 [Halichoeres trimaculatus]|uniref:uncharacterized protein rab44 isoform X2 n=1 Tax=Halichoeres trimaculatus TaxID=147232 RepID=UPI003D9F93F0